MTVPSLYIVGGAGVGKSTFTQELLDRLGGDMGELRDLHKTPNARGTIVTLRGHELAHGWSSAGLYLGCMREFFPGTDGLDRASSITGEAWLDAGGAEAYSFILGEGATLATHRFMSALGRHTELLVLHLVCDEMIKELRLHQRGSTQADSFIKGTAVRSANLAGKMRAESVAVQGIETSSAEDWEIGLRIAEHHLEGMRLAQTGSDYT